LLDKTPAETPDVGRAWLGAPNSIKGPTEAVFHRQSGNNMLVVGQREEAALSILGLALADIGLFSVVSYGVAQRTNEFGIRMALGATRGHVLQLVLGSIARSVGGGLACGLLLSLISKGFLSKWAEGSAANPMAFAAVTLLLVLTSASAALLPARRASSVAPMDALRYE
jgi:ABC-type antimicrobial peptide transport system permease subunit